MTLDESQIKTNKDVFISLVSRISREGANIPLLLDKLENSDFYIAPASTKYHGSYKGGLIDHCLCVYNNLIALVRMKGLSIPEDSIIITSLFHDIAKRNFYEETFSNKKIYCENGDKRDENGRFTWKSVPGYKVKEVDDRFLYGNHEETSEYIIRQFIPLTVEESVAIIHHHGGAGWDSSKVVPQEFFERYPLAALLHFADNLAVCIDKA